MHKRGGAGCGHGFLGATASRNCALQFRNLGTGGNPAAAQHRNDRLNVRLGNGCLAKRKESFSHEPRIIGQILDFPNGLPRNFSIRELTTLSNRANEALKE